MTGEACNKIFVQSIEDYHKYDNINQTIENPHAERSFKSLLYQKNWIDTVQWHLEDIVRDPNIAPDEGMKIKRRIDRSNQERTDLVEQLDDVYLAQFRNVVPKDSARLNTESPAWVLDRMSILCLKIYHMHEQVERTDVNQDHMARCRAKLEILQEQQQDLTKSFDEMLEDIEQGSKYMKVYRQMKMYNDDTLNPILYGKES